MTAATSAAPKSAGPPGAPNADADPAAARAWMIAWLVADAWRIRNPRVLVQETCARLVATGVALDSFTAFVMTLHPDYFGVAHRWRADNQEVTSVMGSHDLWDTPLVRQSPLQDIRDGASAFRWHIESRGGHPDYPVLDEYREQGATDYCAMRLPFQDGSPQTITFTTRAPGGFTAAQLSLVDSLLSYLARLTEVQAINYLATVLLDTYVGRQSGARILNGRIRRGMGETIRAVILMTDLRGFTALTDRLPGDEVLALLNDYFDCLGGPVQDRGGEILKFIGDALLAIFPVPDPDQAAAACAAALDAVFDAHAAARALNDARAADGRATFEFGAALHIGEVMYGNIGTTGRLDFTVIGPAVNLAARIESLTKEVASPVLVSADFAAASDRPLQSLGKHMVKGVAAPVEIFSPRAD
ncbi:MAG: adenylate/guanylate cyclase domain-containing protein [Bauldia litoralis]